jgi:hypothetical protein
MPNLFNEYQTAFKSLTNVIKPAQRQILIEMYRSPNHSLTASTLCSRLKVTDVVVINKLFGNLGNKISEFLSKHPEGYKKGDDQGWTFLATGRVDEIRKHFEWTLRPEVIEALEKLEWVKPYKRTQDQISHYICLGEPKESKQLLARYAAKGYKLDWTINSKAKKGDQVYFYLTDPESAIYATGKVISNAKKNLDKNSDWYGQYMSPISHIKILDNPLKLNTLKKSLPEWRYWKTPIRSTPVPQELLERFQRLVKCRTVDIKHQLETLEEHITKSASFNPLKISDSRERARALIVIRRGQKKFREALLIAYQGRCAITGSNAEAALEAAHITPYSGKDSNAIGNGLLLRGDIHTLFDLGLISINTKTMTVLIDASLLGSDYKNLAGKTLRLPRNVELRPSILALDLHRSESTANYPMEG